MRSRLSLLIVAVGIAAAALAAWLFPRAFPIVALEQSVTRDAALARADSFFRAHSLAPISARTAVRFEGNDSLRTFIELAGGGHDSLNALVKGRDVAPWVWSVRAFVPRDPREARVDFAPDGRIIGFQRKLAEADARPAVAVDSARRLAELVLGTWIDDSAQRWTLVSTSFETKKTSQRIDRTFTFQRDDRRIGGAPIRAEVVVAGDTPAGVRPYVEIPESFRRRYAEMRSWNELVALLASLGALAIAIAGIIALGKYARAGMVRWREPMLVGAVIGGLTLAAALNEMPGSWFDYDTAMSPTTFRVEQLIAALLLGVTTTLLTGFTLAAAEAATRHAFPRHLDWWKQWRYRGTKEVASRVLGGYAVAAVAFAYVAVFYLVTRTLFGWWVPSELLDDPNLIASPMPWISGIAISLNAGVWEEALFRALPLSLLAIWSGSRPARRWWMAAGVVVSALIFGFAHANYESWPPYSRGVEIFIDACFWAVLFLRFGLLLTVVAHFLYDAVLFGIFAASGNAGEYRVTAAIILLALVAPALIVLWRRVRLGGFAAAPDDARFAAWAPGKIEEEPEVFAPRPAAAFSPRSRRLALAAAVGGVIVAIVLPPGPTLGPQFTAGRARVLQTSDSVLGAHGDDPARWRRLTTIGTDTLTGWSRFLRKHKLIDEAQRFASTYVPATWWVVRYVHTSGTAAERAEEWRVRLWPDGRPLDARHLIPDSARKDTADAATVRSTALKALARAGVDTLVLKETDVKETARPARRDVAVTYTDTSVKLPAGAAARAWVQIAGDEPLVARRGVELPEAFIRAHRARGTNRVMIFGVTIMVFLALVVTGALMVKRRCPIVLNDGIVEGGRRRTVLAVGALILVMALGEVNGLPSHLYGYDTAEPWSTFIGSTALGFVSTIIVALLLFGLWRTLEALRVRVPIPMLPDAPSRSASIDVLAAGLGIGGFVYATQGLLAVLTREAVPHTPTTGLDTLVPLLSDATGVLGSTIVMLVSIGIPILVVAGLPPRRGLKALIAVVMVTLVAAAVWALDPADGDVDLLRAALAVAAGALILGAIIVWGKRAAWSWIVAALAYQALDGLRATVYAPVWQGQGAGALAFVVAATLIVLIARRAASHERSVAPA